jgi:hypothetical protein
MAGKPACWSASGTMNTLHPDPAVQEETGDLEGNMWLRPESTPALSEE